MFREYKRLGGSLNKRGRATDGLWLKWPTDLLGMEERLAIGENNWRWQRPLGAIKPQTAWHQANGASSRKQEIESKNQATELVIKAFKATKDV